MSLFDDIHELGDISFLQGLIILVPILVLLYLERKELAFFLSLLKEKILGKSNESFSLGRHKSNPLLSPRTYLGWEKEGVFNPAALLINDTVHLIYRAIGADGVSRLGYTQSKDGVLFDDGLTYPVFTFKKSQPIDMSGKRFDPVMYPSGGSWGGAEDPRMVLIDGRIYVTFNMFEDNWMLRVAVISLSEKDFLAKRFDRWEGPTVLSHGKRDKNWVLFPEKINGQFAILHSIIGENENEVRIEYIDELELLSSRRFFSPDPQKVPDSKVVWHVHPRSAGPPPIKTDEGWLVFYHANDEKEPHKYKLGAKLLDLNDPSKIIARSKCPVLEPDMWYENDWKPGIIYACGAVVKEETLHIYYGGGDKHVCSAHTKIKDLLKWLKQDIEEKPEFIKDN